MLDLPETWTLQNEVKTLERVDIVWHLIHCETTDWMPRVKLLLQLARLGSLSLWTVGTRLAFRGNRWSATRRICSFALQQNLGRTARLESAAWDSTGVDVNPVVWEVHT